MENRLNSMEEDLEEEQMNSETAQDKARKAMQQADTLSIEVSQLQSNLQKAESLKSQLEKQVHSWIWRSGRGEEGRRDGWRGGREGGRGRVGGWEGRGKEKGGRGGGRGEYH